MTDTESELAELAAWLHEHIHETPAHREVQVRRHLERAEQIILGATHRTTR